MLTEDDATARVVYLVAFREKVISGISPNIPEKAVNESLKIC